jgi:cytochrome c biogenesis protein CcmG, thiol:disulfide interchange protein DsbE
MRVSARWIAMIVALVLVALGIVLAVSHRSEASVPRLVQQHRPAPAFNVKTLDGKTITTASLAGKAYVVNFFNSWCIPCRQEHPALQAFYDEHKSERDFAMLGIVREDDDAAIRGYVAAEKVAWPVALEGADDAALEFGTRGQPETYVISPDGVAVCGSIGPTTQALLDVWLQAARTGKQCNA